MAEEAEEKRHEATIENPLRGCNETDLVANVEHFAEDYLLEDVLEDLKRGARIAQYPRHYENAARGDAAAQEALIVKLKPFEILALRNEKYGLLKQSKDLYLTVIACACAALVQGWDETGSNGANLSWPEIFNLTTSPTHCPVHKSIPSHEWIIGAVNAAPYFSAALIGCLLTDPINTRFGRRGTIFFAGLWCFASAIGSAFTNSWQALFATRFCLGNNNTRKRIPGLIAYKGIGMGAKASTAPVFAAESAPAYFRGSIVMCWQLWVAFGILLGFSANLIVTATPGAVSWRLQVGSAFIPTIPLLILIYFAPESPRWYMKKNTPASYRKAYEAMIRLRNTPIQAARDFYLAHLQLEIERRYDEKSQALRSAETQPRISMQMYVKAYGARFIELFTVKRIRRATLAACTVMLAQQMCGINVLSFYSSTLFNQAGDKKKTALEYSWAFGLINTVFALPAVKTIDKFGRRGLLLCSLLFMAVTLLIAAFAFKLPGPTCTTEPSGNQRLTNSGSSARTPLIGAFLFLFAAAYSPGVGPVPFTYSAEVFPLSHREVGMSFSVAVNLFFAGVLTIFFPSMTRGMGNTGALGLFVAFNALAFIMVFLWVPESSQRTLEALTKVFEVRTREHMRYQVAENLPYFLRRYVLLGGKKIEVQDLYFEEPEELIYEKRAESLPEEQSDTTQQQQQQHGLDVSVQEADESSAWDPEAGVPLSIRRTQRVFNTPYD